MRRLLTAAAVSTLTLGLVGLVPGAAAAEDCDPSQPFVVQKPDDVAVGIAGVEGFRLTVEGAYDCAPGGRPYARITTPRGAQVVVDLEDDEQPGPGQFRYSAFHPVDPVLLRNPDAGTWQISYEIEGERYAGTTVAVRRATRLAFDAGPEPVRHGKVTFKGRLERADWEWRAWRSYGKKRVLVSALGPEDGGTRVVVAKDRTSSSGRYRVTKRFPGTDRYQASYAGGSNAAPSLSRVDTVRRAR